MTEKLEKRFPGPHDEFHPVLPVTRAQLGEVSIPNIPHLPPTNAQLGDYYDPNNPEFPVTSARLVKYSEWGP